MNHPIRDLLDMNKIRELAESFFSVFGIPFCLETTGGEVLLEAGSLVGRPCFHQRNSKTAGDAVQKEGKTRKSLLPGETCAVFKRPGGVMEVAAPIAMDGLPCLIGRAGPFFPETPGEKEARSSEETARGGDSEAVSGTGAFPGAPVISADRVQAAMNAFVLSLELIIDARLASKRDRDAMERMKSLHEKARHELEKGKTARAALLEKSRLLEILIDAIPSPMFCKDAEGVYRECNQAFANQILGLPREEIVGHSVFDLPNRIPRRLARVYHQKDMEMIQDPGSQFYESDVRCSDGKTRTFMFNKACLTDPTGSTTGIVGVMVDVTRQKAMETALKESEERYRGLVENALLPIGVVRDGAFIYANPAAVRLLDANDPGDLVGASLEALVHPRDREAFHTIFPPAETGTPESGAPSRGGEIRFVSHKGRVVHLEMTTLDIQYADGAARMFMAVDITERKKGEHAVKRRTEELGFIFDSMEALVHVVDPGTYDILHINRFGANLFGPPADKPCYAFFHNRKTPCEYCSIRKAGGPSGSKTPMEYHNEVVNRDFLSTNRMIPWPDGRQVKLEISIDVTKLKIAARTLKESDARLAQIVDGGSVATFVIGPDHVVTHWNRACEQMTGVSSKEMVGTHRQWAPFYPEKRPVLADLILEVMEGEKIGGYYAPEFGPLDMIDGAYWAEGFFPGLGGEDRWLYFTAAPLKDPEGRVVGAVETIQDFTARKESEAALKESEEQYRTLHENVPVGLFRVSPEGEFISVNRALIKMAGEDSEASLVGTSVVDASLGLKMTLELLRRIRSHGRLEDMELPLERKDGTTFRGSISANTAVDAEGRILYVDGIIQDITGRWLAEREKSRLREQLRQLQKMEAIGTLSGGIAHDFNNILGGILGCAELLAMDIPREETGLHYYVSQIDRAATRAADLVKQILEFSRQTRVSFRPVEIQLIIKEALKLLRATLPKNIAIEENMASGTARIMADATQIHQIVMNLCTNAHHAMRGVGGIMAVELKRIHLLTSEPSVPSGLIPGEYIQLSVRDDGRGIEPENLAKVFDPYFTTKERGEGTGLGLSVTLGIVKNHGGAIHVDSAPGRGSTFKVLLPVLETEVSSVETGVETTPEGDERILFVDDEEFFLEIIKRQLESLGYNVTAVSTSPEAVAIFKSRPDDFDLVITDQAMPKMTGVELASALMEIRPAIPIILCTGFSETVDDQSAPEFGIAKFVMKPVSKRQLARAIRDVLKKGEGGGKAIPGNH